MNRRISTRLLVAVVLGVVVLGLIVHQFRERILADRTSEFDTTAPVETPTKWRDIFQKAEERSNDLRDKYPLNDPVGAFPFKKDDTESDAEKVNENDH